MNNAALSVSSQVLSRRIGEETVLLNLETGQYFGLEGVGARIWELVEGGKTAVEIARTLVLEYEADEKQIETDVEKMIETFRVNGLVV